MDVVFYVAPAFAVEIARPVTGNGSAQIRGLLLPVVTLHIQDPRKIFNIKNGYYDRI